MLVIFIIIVMMKKMMIMLIDYQIPNQLNEGKNKVLPDDDDDDDDDDQEKEKDFDYYDAQNLTEDPPKNYLQE